MPSSIYKKKPHKEYFKNKKRLKKNRKLYNFILLPKKNNIFFCLTKENGDLIKN